MKQFNNETENNQLAFHSPHRYPGPKVSQQPLLFGVAADFWLIVTTQLGYWKLFDFIMEI